MPFSIAQCYFNSDTFTRYKDLKWLLILWAFLCLLAAAKGYWQRNHGFDSAELYWLLVEGGAGHISFILAYAIFHSFLTQLITVHPWDCR